MVTGVETTGLILAALRLLIEPLSVYKMGLGKTEIVLGFKQKRYKVKVERLRLRLQGQSAPLHLNLAKLVGRAARTRISQTCQKTTMTCFRVAKSEKV